MNAGLIEALEALEKEKEMCIRDRREHGLQPYAGRKDV